MYGVFASISHPNYKISLHAYVRRYEVIPHIKTGTFDRAFAQMQGHLLYIVTVLSMRSGI